jgi:hypothetical protein
VLPDSNQRLLSAAVNPMLVIATFAEILDLALYAGGICVYNTAALLSFLEIQKWQN